MLNLRHVMEQTPRFRSRCKPLAIAKGAQLVSPSAFVRRKVRVVCRLLIGSKAIACRLLASPLSATYRSQVAYLPAIISSKAYSVAFCPMGIMYAAMTCGSSELG